jgi:hypothetical protein
MAVQQQDVQATNGEKRGARYASLATDTASYKKVMRLLSSEQGGTRTA